MQADRNRQVVERYWTSFFSRDWIQVARFFAPNAHYTDAGVDPVGARGPAEIIARLTGLDVPVRYGQLPRHIIAQGDLVVTEHLELWTFASGEEFQHPFVSVMELKGGLIERWHDYSHAPNIFNNAPSAWVEYAKNWRERIKPLAELWPGEGF